MIKIVLAAAVYTVWLLIVWALLYAFGEREREAGYK